MLIIDNFEKANKKLKKYEEYSDVQTSALEDKEQLKKRQRKRNSKYIYSSEEEEDSENLSLCRPPKISTFGKVIFQ